MSRLNIKIALIAQFIQAVSIIAKIAALNPLQAGSAAIISFIIKTLAVEFTAELRKNAPKVAVVDHLHVTAPMELLIRQIVIAVEQVILIPAAAVFKQLINGMKEIGHLAILAVNKQDRLFVKII
jgi:hypothetical protein